MPDTKKIDPFDVEALEKSLNDSATRVSTIWISFLIFSLYLLTAATTVTHRQLLLAEPVKLPVLNIDLPLWGFFFLAPILFVTFHAYVLLQVLLLGRTAAAYNEALDKAVKPPSSNAAMRQRLANTLFAQIFAGSPREREGWLGRLLGAMAWITLAIAPIMILLAFQFSFLSYHSHIATWSHRLLILIELFAFLLIWPLALDAQKDFQWASAWLNLKHMTAIPLQLFRAEQERRDGLLWLRESAVSMAACCLFVLLSLSLGTFPGEPHVNLFTGQSLSSVQCDRWFSKKIDRLNLRGVEVLDFAKLARIEAAVPREIHPSESTRALSLQERNFNCGVFDKVNFRRADFSRSVMIGASFVEAELEAASFDEAQLNKGSFGFAKMQRTSFRGANLRGALLDYASGPGARFDAALLQGSSLDTASLVGASLNGTQLQGASLQGTDLRGVFLVSTALTAADLSDASLQGAFLSDTQLQGANLNGTKTNLAVLNNAFLWKTAGQDCGEARVIGPVHDRVVGFNIDGSPFYGERRQMVELTDTVIGQLIGVATEDTTPERKALIARRLQTLSLEQSKGDAGEPSMKAWEVCAARSSDFSEHDFFQKHSDLLRQIACDAVIDWKPIIEGIIDNWIFDMHDPPDRVDYLGRALLGMDGRECRSSKYVDDFLSQRVRARLKTDRKVESIMP